MSTLPNYLHDVHLTVLQQFSIPIKGSGCSARTSVTPAINDMLERLRTAQFETPEHALQDFIARMVRHCNKVTDALQKALTVSTGTKLYCNYNSIFRMMTSKIPKPKAPVVYGTFSTSGVTGAFTLQVPLNQVNVLKCFSEDTKLKCLKYGGGFAQSSYKPLFEFDDAAYYEVLREFQEQFRTLPISTKILPNDFGLTLREPHIKTSELEGTVLQYRFCGVRNKSTEYYKNNIVQFSVLFDDYIKSDCTIDDLRSFVFQANLIGYTYRDIITTLIVSLSTEIDASKDVSYDYVIDLYNNF